MIDLLYWMPFLDDPPCMHESAVRTIWTNEAGEVVTEFYCDECGYFYKGLFDEE